MATWGGADRPEHGTRKTGGVWGPLPDHYRGVGAKEFAGLVRGLYAPQTLLSRLDRDGGEADVYFAGIKA